MHKHWHLLHRKSALLCSDKNPEYWFWAISQKFSSHLWYLENTIPFHLPDRDDRHHHRIIAYIISVYYNRSDISPAYVNSHCLCWCWNCNLYLAKAFFSKWIQKLLTTTSKHLSSLLNYNLLQAENYGLSNIKATHTTDSEWKARNVTSNQNCRENEAITIELTKI